MTKKRLAQLRQQAEEAVKKANREEKGLFRYGRPLFSDYNEHRSVLQEIRQRRNRTLRAIGEEAEEIRREGEEEVERCRNFDRTAVLLPSEQAQLGHRLDLIRSLVSRLGVKELRDRLDAVAHNDGDKVGKFAWWTAASEKAEELSQPAKMAFIEPLNEIDKQLFEEEFQRRAAPAAELVREAGALEEHCHVKSKDAKNLADAYSREHHVHGAELAERQKWARGGRPMERTFTGPPTRSLGGVNEGPRQEED